ncbi:MAG TPA: ABC transporter ATP-binding protein [Thermoanaerobaculales bacterium]|nr:ABC transporter ATP-binding protein [Thermoanaerobaculales bacterium]HPA80124.1 ABC transporter ATP-binding protein [Thermoanaerobaculales bacterium]HQL30578.1 ABC transporter ATP-binding protein [Thermoanaerobaculales bacterium]HQN95873.1 ABC transporter ATP-binding protein [Thermoanaerobaculales bacterium]HQP43933.1 ABC transporter ATP-binding protein [Thermoanaerobaculales bacterium]
MIHLRSVARTFDPQRQVLRGVDLDVDAGELVAITGRSGAGKTTLLNVIGGLDSGYQGSVEVAGRRLSELGDRQLSAFRNRSVGFVFQAYNLLEQLTVSENVALPSVFAGGSHGREGREEVRRRALESLAAVGLDGRANDRPAVLSGGERQRVAIARALLQRTPLLLCDEPTGNLDEATGAQIAELLREVRERRGVTVVVATHDAAIRRLAGRVLELRDGALAEREPELPGGGR